MVSVLQKYLLVYFQGHTGTFIHEKSIQCYTSAETMPCKPEMNWYADSLAQKCILE